MQSAAKQIINTQLLILTTYCRAARSMNTLPSQILNVTENFTDTPHWQNEI